MEPTTNIQTGGKSSKTIIWVIILILIIVGIVMMMSNKTEAPLVQNTNTSGESVENSDLQASVMGAMDFDNEASLKEIDQEFQ